MRKRTLNKIEQKRYVELLQYALPSKMHSSNFFHVSGSAIEILSQPDYEQNTGYEA